MSPRRLVAALVALLFLSPLAVTSAAAEGVLTIRGARSAYALLTVRRTVYYDLARARVDHGDGRWGGFAIGGDGVALWSRYNGPRVPTIAGHSVTRGTLRPGRYRVRLFADDGHPVTATIPWTGGDVTLTPVARLDVKFQVKQELITADGPAKAIVLPQDGRAGVSLNAVVLYDALAATSVHLVGCLAPRPTSCAKAQVTVHLDGPEAGLNGFGVGFADYQRRLPTKGLYVRGSVSGTGTGLLTVLTMRHYG